MELKKLFIVMFLIIGSILFAQMPSEEQAKKAGENVVKTLVEEIGKPLTANATKIKNNTYFIDEGLGKLSKIYYIQNNTIVGLAMGNRMPSEDIALPIYFTYLISLQAYLGTGNVNDGIHSWDYRKYSIQLSSPKEDANGNYAVLIMIFNKYIGK